MAIGENGAITFPASLTEPAQTFASPSKGERESGASRPRPDGLRDRTTVFALPPPRLGAHPSRIDQAVITDAATRAAIAPALVEAISYVESRHDPRAVSPKGAIGAMQLMPSTAKDLAVDPRDPIQNVRGGATYVRKLIDANDGDLIAAIAAYNSGPGAVHRYGGVPPFRETRAYVAAVLDRLALRAFEEPSR
jgi:soluble lytic murein transglycosylase-like protein